MLRALVADARITKVNLVVSENALRVLWPRSWRFLGATIWWRGCSGTRSEKVQHHIDANIGANIASGSYPSEGMIVLPCSMGTLGRNRPGPGQHLDPTSRRCVPEGEPATHSVRARNPLQSHPFTHMQLASDAGAVIFPVIPTLYNKPQSTAEMALQFVQRVLAHIGLPQPGAYQCRRTSSAAPASSLGKLIAWKRSLSGGNRLGRFEKVHRARKAQSSGTAPARDDRTPR